MHKSVFWVWRRSDGYVSVTKGSKMPGNGRDKFELLLETEDWSEAYEAVESSRDERHHALVATWNEEQA